jgi:hypothetical protein
MLTRNGVCYNLKISPYKFRINNVRFVFSSQLHLEKFKVGYLENRNIMNKKITERHGVETNLTLFCDIAFYKKIETRGFLLQLDTGEYVCQEKVQLDGEKVTLKE